MPNIPHDTPRAKPVEPGFEPQGKAGSGQTSAPIATDGSIRASGASRATARAREGCAEDKPLVDRFGNRHAERVLTNWSPAALAAMGIRRANDADAGGAQ